jgi:hypothetical protein
MKAFSRTVLVISCKEQLVFDILYYVLYVYIEEGNF